LLGYPGPGKISLSFCAREVFRNSVFLIYRKLGSNTLWIGFGKREGSAAYTMCVDAALASNRDSSEKPEVRWQE